MQWQYFAEGIFQSKFTRLKSDNAENESNWRQLLFLVLLELLSTYSYFLATKSNLKRRHSRLDRCHKAVKFTRFNQQIQNTNAWYILKVFLKISNISNVWFWGPKVEISSLSILISDLISTRNLNIDQM